MRTRHTVTGPPSRSGDDLRGDLTVLHSFRSLHLDAREVGLLAPSLQVSDVIQKTSGVGEIPGRPGVYRLLLAVVKAGRAALEIAGAAGADATELCEPLFLSGLLRLDDGDPLLDAGLHDVRHVLGRFREEVRKVCADPALDEADQEEVGEPAGQHPVQGVGALSPPLR